ncbi:MFS transporter [Micromonospora schwarzwaldensis]|uniref:MFS transporter n=1 Tax=Micromonospora sp. DSM 45708 TaxID=3111767 RepID=UPI0031D133E4
MAGRLPTDSALRAVTVVFFLNGVIVGASLARVPALRDQVEAATGPLGLALVAVGVGSLVAMPFTAHWTRRFGSARVVLAAAAVCGTAWVGAGLSTSVPLLGAALFLVGAGIGVWDVAMNVQGHRVEQRDGRARLPWLHACVSAGVVAGAGFAALCGRLGLRPLAQFTVVSAAVVLSTALAVRAFLPDTDPRPDGTQPDRGGPSGARRRSMWWYPPALLVGLVTVSTAFGEGAAGDWLALTMVDTKAVSEASAAAGFAAYSAAMVLGRVYGGRAVNRWGRVGVLRVCGTTATAGVLLVCLADATPLVMAGALLWGVGLSVVFPVTMSAAGELVPGRGAEGITVVSTIGYAGFLLGPPLLGLVADVSRLDRALLIVAAFTAMIAVAATATRERVPTRTVVDDVTGSDVR